MTDHGAARELWQRYEAVHDVVYFAEESRRAAAELGLRGFWMGYTALRVAPVGAIGPEVATAMFYGFHPERISRALPDAWDHATPSAVLAARRTATAATLRRVGVPEDAGTGEAADLLWKASQAVETAGRALGAANCGIDRPADALEVLWQASTTLREHRGDGHVAVLLAREIGPVEAHLIKVAAGETGEEMLRDARRWSPEQWEAGRARLRRRGWLDDPGALTDAGRDEHDRVEQATDRLAATPWAALSAGEVSRLIELLDPIARQVLDSGLLPEGNPTGLTQGAGR